MTGLIIDNFAGGGGASTGIKAALGRPIDVAINHDEAAIAVHAANHPGTRHYCQSIHSVDPLDVTGGAQVALVWFSPDCKHHSKAKGGKPRDKGIRDLAQVVPHWIERLGGWNGKALTRPERAAQIIMLENVEEFRHWGPLDANNMPIKERRGEEFDLWVRHTRRLGYVVEWRVLRACDYGAPTSRKRLFLIARRDGQPIVWPAPTHGKPGSAGVAAGIPAGLHPRPGLLVRNRQRRAQIWPAAQIATDCQNRHHRGACAGAGAGQRQPARTVQRSGESGISAPAPFTGLRMFGYSIIHADPPWAFDNYSASGECRNANQHYDTMTWQDIADLPVGSLAAGDCALFLWVVNPQLDRAFDVMRAWGFRYTSVAFTWAKRTKRDTGWHMGLGYGTRANAEICLLGMTGQLRRRDAGVRSLIVDPLREHSRKPDRVRGDIERLYGDQFRCDLFSRQRREGWDCWGNEVEKFDQAAPLAEQPHAATV